MRSCDLELALVMYRAKTLGIAVWISYSCRMLHRLFEKSYVWSDNYVNST